MITRNAIEATEETEGYTGDTYCADCGALLENGSATPKLNHIHKFDTKKSDDGSHWLECSCGARDGVAAHTFGAYTSTAAAHTHECLDCGHKVTENHTPNPDDFDCSTPTTCIVCGFVIDKAREHTWGAWESDGSDHVARCLNPNCDAETRAKHTGGTATCSSPAVCDICCLLYGEKNASYHVGGTEVRDYRAPTATTGGYTGDTYCLGCGSMLAQGETLGRLDAQGHQMAKKSDGVAHWLECSRCGIREEYAEHTFDGYIETAQGHARKCEVCGYQSDFEVHTPGNNDDCETPVYCTVCLYEMAPARTHSFGGILFSDEYGHWHICTNPGCTQADGKAAHSGGTATCTKLAVCHECFTPYGELDPDHHVRTELRGAIEATDRTNGYTGDVYCSDCGALISRGSVIQKGTQSGANVPQTGDNGHILLWLSLMIASGLAVCACFWTGRRRKYE